MKTLTVRLRFQTLRSGREGGRERRDGGREEGEGEGVRNVRTRSQGDGSPGSPSV